MINHFQARHFAARHFRVFALEVGTVIAPAHGGSDNGGLGGRRRRRGGDEEERRRRRKIRRPVTPPHQAPAKPEEDDTRKVRALRMKQAFADLFGDKSMLPNVASDTVPRIAAADMADDDEIEILLLSAA